MASRNARAELIQASRQACAAFESQGSKGLDVEHVFSTTPIPAVEEHGVLGSFPFVGRRFTGIDEVKLYFQLVRQAFTVEQLQLPPWPLTANQEADPLTEIPLAISNRWLVDVEGKAAAVVGTITLAFPNRQEPWTGKILFRFRFFEEKRREAETGELKVEQMEVWNEALICTLLLSPEPMVKV